MQDTGDERWLGARCSARLYGSQIVDSAFESQYDDGTHSPHNIVFAAW